MNTTSVLPPISTITTSVTSTNLDTPTMTTSPFQSPMSSVLSNNDRNFIEFTRCLYRVKSVVQELEVFSQTVQANVVYQQEGNTHEFVRQVQQYLEDSFKKFNHMCRVLLVVLSKLENQTVKRERIDSFRQEIMNEWRKAILVRQDLVQLVQRKHKDHLCQSMMPSPSSQQANEESESSESTTPEPKSSQELYLHSSTSSSASS